MLALNMNLKFFRIEDDFPELYQDKVNDMNKFAFGIREDKTATKIKIYGTELQLRIKPKGQDHWVIQDAWTPEPQTSAKSKGANRPQNTRGKLDTGQILDMQKIVYVNFHDEMTEADVKIAEANFVKVGADIGVKVESVSIGKRALKVSCETTDMAEKLLTYIKKQDKDDKDYKPIFKGIGFAKMIFYKS